MTAHYLEGAMEYELAICQSKVSERLKENGVKMRITAYSRTDLSNGPTLCVKAIDCESRLTRWRLGADIETKSSHLLGSTAKDPSKTTSQKLICTLLFFSP
jgi:hypothetical protein